MYIKMSFVIKKPTLEWAMLDFISSYGPFSPMVKFSISCFILDKNAAKWLVIVFDPSLKLVTQFYDYTKRVVEITTPGTHNSSIRNKSTTKIS